jgi:hypothetical protein
MRTEVSAQACTIQGTASQMVIDGGKTAHAE